ncbi:hypothetical protein [Streptomyces sp. NTH33]|uniref:hypothetical protein n=1 Tax=Streptomyces sp. NTH33 TaxID=1735453 RepID=UPI0011B941F4|nr:hypothetical protein [Streptomyces sp. NTH33]
MGSRRTVGEPACRAVIALARERDEPSAAVAGRCWIFRRSEGRTGDGRFAHLQVENRRSGSAQGS